NFDGPQVLVREAAIQDGDQDGRHDLRPLPERGKPKYAADHDDVDGPVPLKGRGSLEERLNQLDIVHEASLSGVRNQEPGVNKRGASLPASASYTSRATPPPDLVPGS